MTTPGRIASAFLCFAVLGPPAARAQELFPYDSAITVVVDKRPEIGEFTTIMEAIGWVKGQADASVDKRYQILVVPAATPYDECVDISGLRFTEIAGLGGLPRIDNLGTTASTCPYPEQDIVGCRNASEACGPVTIRNISAGGIQIGTPIVLPPGDNGNYRDVIVKDVHLEVEAGTPFLEFISCNDPQPECSFAVDGLTMRSGDAFTAQVRVTSGSYSGVETSAHARGTITNSYIRAGRCPWKAGLLKIGPLGDSQRSSMLVEGNTFICNDMAVTGDSEGVGFFWTTGGMGTTRIVDNQFIAFIRSDNCGGAHCEHYAFKNDQGDVNTSDIFIQDNTVLFVMMAGGLAADSLAFVDLGPTAAPIRNEKWHLSGNDFRMIVDGGDFNPANVRDVRLRSVAQDNTILIRDQELRHGIQADPGSTSLVRPWRSHAMEVSTAVIDGALLVPTVPPAPGTASEGQLWTDPLGGRLCYRAGGRTLCLQGAPPCGDGLCDAGQNPCSCPADCGPPENPETSCNDGIDNDCDSWIDGDDPDACGRPFTRRGPAPPE
jgi:hypothetical protein